MRDAWFVVVCAIGCSQGGADGSVDVSSDGTAQVFASACLRAVALSCNDAAVPLELRHDGVVTPMTYGGLVLPEHSALAPIGDPTTLFDVTDGHVHARIYLPPSFDLTGAPTSALTRGDSLHLTWVAAGSAMRWDYSFTCSNKNGGGVGTDLDDSGRADISVAPIADEADRIGSVGSCMVELMVRRDQSGKLDDDFPASEATGSQQRRVTFTLTL